MLRLIPDSLPHLNDISINWGVLAFAMAVSVVAGIVFGLAPAWTLEPQQFERDAAAGRTGAPSGSRDRSRARQILVISEVALSLC